VPGNQLLKPGRCRTGGRSLVVMYQHVVPIEAGTRDGWSTAEASMRAVPVVVMEPAREVRRAFLEQCGNRPQCRVCAYR